MLKIQRLGHLTMQTPDLERAVSYARDLHGLVVVHRDAQQAHLASKQGMLCLTYRQGPDVSFGSFSFEVSPDADFRAYATVLAAQGIRSETRSDPFPGVSECLTFLEPDGTRIELFKSWTFVCDNQNVAGVGPLKIGHVALFVPDLKKKVDFYTQLLGFRVSDWIGDHFVFMRCNPDHHSVNFFEGDSLRLHHVAYELKDMVHVQNGCEALSMLRVPIGWGPLRHGPGHNVAIYHRDPDDQVVEYYCELDQMKNEDLGYFEPRPWHVDRPQRPKVWPARTWVSGWGTPPAPNFARNERALGPKAD
jgi:catechol 2,3-dioxygenase-like lactoylglutathione lyase family enzyme